MDASQIIMSMICVFFGNFISREPLVLLLLCSGAVDAIDNIRFTSMKSIDGDDVCAVGISPVMSIGMRSEIQCTNECSNRRSPTKCIGVNYKKANKTCDIFDNDQTAFVVQSGCKYYTNALFVGPNVFAAKGKNTDAALNKPSFQCTTLDKNAASFANDGLYNTQACSSHAAHIARAWWAVDLGRPMFVRALNVNDNLNADAGYRLTNFKTWLSNNQPYDGKELETAKCSLCHQFAGSVAVSGTAYVNCYLTLPAFKYVIIESAYTSMCLSSVQVFVVGCAIRGHHETDMALYPFITETFTPYGTKL